MSAQRALSDDERARIAATYGCIVKPHIAVTRILPRTLEEILKPDPTVEISARDRIKARSALGVIARQRGQAMARAMRKTDPEIRERAPRPVSTQEVEARVRKEQLRLMMVAGCTRSEAAEKIGVNICTIDDYASQLRRADPGLAFRRAAYFREGMTLGAVSHRDMRALALFREGATYDDICDKLRIKSRETVRQMANRLRDLGHTWVTPKRRQFTGVTSAVQARRERMLALADGTRTRQEVADVLGIPLGTVDSDSNALRKAGQAPRYSAKGQGFAGRRAVAHGASA